ncbi:hypothetical protein [Bradyrhizobium sp. ORS 285]|uniref:hypothetical protein n=1 Tax=Bradyrhizobium sp. ORS 285 TaxID=115808 RepID=UPI0012F987BF|nr:hypothetical protein [Bradyrhizobium sp. ORS 285]
MRAAATTVDPDHASASAGQAEFFLNVSDENSEAANASGDREEPASKKQKRNNVKCL